MDEKPESETDSRGCACTNDCVHKLAMTYELVADTFNYATLDRIDILCGMDITPYLTNEMDEEKMAEREKKTLLEILEDLQFIRGNIDTLADVDSNKLESRAIYINDLLNTVSWHIQTNLIEKD